MVVVSPVFVGGASDPLAAEIQSRASVIGLASSLTFMLFAAALEGNEISWHLTRCPPGRVHTHMVSVRRASLAYTYCCLIYGVAGACEAAYTYINEITAPGTHCTLN